MGLGLHRTPDSLSSLNRQHRRARSVETIQTLPCKTGQGTWAMVRESLPIDAATLNTGGNHLVRVCSSLAESIANKLGEIFRAQEQRCENLL